MQNTGYRVDPRFRAVGVGLVKREGATGLLVAQRLSRTLLREQKHMGILTICDIDRPLLGDGASSQE
jgi:hypothetical protein